MSVVTLNIEQLIQEYAYKMAEQMKEIAQKAYSEEDVRHGCNSLIDIFLKNAEISITGRHEYALKGGRIDSKYGAVIIEYKASKGPARITENSNAPGNQAVIAQIKQRFKDFQSNEHIAPDRLFGIGCDGANFIFVRYRSGKFEVENPQPVTTHSVERLLRALVSLGAHGYSFTPERLTESFGADNALAQNGIRDIYQVISKTDNPKAQTFFNQWKILFGEVCGYDVTGKNEKIKILANYYSIPHAQPAELLFSVHTYYAIFIKLLASEIATSFSRLGFSVLKKCISAPTTAKLLSEMRNLEQGGIWSQIGITNFLEGDLFSWYLAAWNERMATVVRGIVQELDNYDPTTLSVEPVESRDLLKKLYQHLFPKSVRHDLGEYYTPDWLAEHVLNELDYNGDPNKRLLDPACGSGTFLVLAINRVKAWFEAHRHECGFGEKELVAMIVRNIIGFDLNPLAVMAARTNCLLAIRDLLKFTSNVELPIYLCDSIMTTAKYGELFISGGETDKVRKLKTSAGEFIIPIEVATNPEQIGKYADTLEDCVKNRYATHEFINRCTEEGLPVAEVQVHRQLYEQLSTLDANNQNGIWARIIKNAFAPLFIKRVDYVVGNPPWVNWESLPGDYRDDMKPLWQQYNLFTLSGTAGRLGGGKKDLSMLFVYSSVDNYLVDGGRLGFVITQTVFKTQGAGDGFRRFQFSKYNQDNKPFTIIIKPLVVNDLSNSQVFEGATNRTAIFLCEKAKNYFVYPVPYVVWRGPARIGQDETLEQVLAQTTRHTLGAIPVEPYKKTSPWLTAPNVALVLQSHLARRSHDEMACQAQSSKKALERQ
jgi:hypothetical protein